MSRPRRTWSTKSRNSQGGRRPPGPGATPGRLSSTPRSDPGPFLQIRVPPVRFCVHVGARKRPRQTPPAHVFSGGREGGGLVWAFPPGPHGFFSDGRLGDGSHNIILQHRQSTLHGPSFSPHARRIHPPRRRLPGRQISSSTTSAPRGAGARLPNAHRGPSIISIVSTPAVALPPPADLSLLSRSRAGEQKGR